MLKMYIELVIKINATIIFFPDRISLHMNKRSGISIWKTLCFTKTEEYFIEIPEDWPLITKEGQYTMDLPYKALYYVCSPVVGKRGKQIWIDKNFTKGRVAMQ